MARQGADVVAIDMAEASLSVARLHQLESKLDIDYRCIPAEELAEQEPASFDVVTCLEMLEHVPDPSSVIAACASILKPNGKIFFSTLNRNPKSFLFAIIGAEYILNLLPNGTHTYEKFIKPSELREWCSKNNLKFLDIIGMSYNPILKSYKLTKDCSVNYLVEVGL